MKVRVNWIILILCSALGLISGVALGRWQQDRPKQQTRAAQHQPSTTSTDPVEPTDSTPVTPTLGTVRSFDETLLAANECDRNGNPIGFGRVIVQWLRLASTEEIEALFEPEKRMAIQQRSRNENDLTWGLGGGTLELALAQWAELDNDAAVVWALAQDTVPEFESRMPDTLKGHVPWLKRDPDAALASITSAPPAIRDHSLPLAKRFLAGRSSTIDFDNALQLGVDAGNYSMMWSRADASIASIISAALEAETLKDADLEELLQLLIPGANIERPADQPVRDALRSVATIAKSSSCQSLRSVRLADAFGVSFGIFTPGPATGGQLYSLIDYDPAGTIALLNSTQNPKNRRYLISSIFNGNGRDYAIRERLELYRQLPTDERPKISRMDDVIRTAARFAPRTTLQWMENLLSDHPDKSTVQTLTRLAGSNGANLAHQSSEAALQAIDALENGPFRDSVITGAIQGMVSHDLKNALRLSRELTGDARAKAEATVMQEFAKTEGADATIALLRDVEDPAQQRALVEAIAANTFIRYDGVPPHDAVKIFQTFLAGDQQASANASTLIHGWAQVDPLAAAEWAMETESLSNHAWTLISAWRGLDLQAATEFARNLPPGPIFDAGSRKIIDLALNSDPHTALEWAAALSKPNLRVERLKDAAVSIERYATEPDEARRAISELTIPEAEKAAVIEHLETPSKHF
ncbi:MAG: hypothetical protein ACI9R3_003962 [Verrucomicrobiales bacterium]